MKNIAIIPARGGSKRIPRKNIKNFAGKPIIAYSIEAALNSGIFYGVAVSTDDNEIVRIAEKYGAAVPFMRSEENSNDMAMTAPVLEEVIYKYKKLGQEFDYGCCIYPTAAFVSPDRLKESFLKIQKTAAKTLIPVVKFSYPIQRALKIENDRLSLISPENMNVRSQDLMPTYHDIGQFYWFKIESFLENPTLFSDFTTTIEVPESEVQDIDNEEDWKIAEMKYRILRENVKI